MCLCAGSASIFGVQPSSSSLLRASCDAHKLKPMGAAIHQRQLSSSSAAFKPQLARHRAQLCKQVRPDTVCLGPMPHCLGSVMCCWYPSCAGDLASAFYPRVLSLSDMIAPAFLLLVLASCPASDLPCAARLMHCVLIQP